jgi:hypothetical protein
MINKSSAIFGLVSTLFLGAIAYPVSAQTNDASNAQNASQGVSIDGNNNTVYQTINQTTINRPGRGQGPRSQDQSPNHWQSEKSSARSPENHSESKYKNWNEKDKKGNRKEDRDKRDKWKH